ncbi:hypothetical protein Hypma_000341 [Hypsizygus marmoreus]|uniref:Uncharacterized protein n=1 Tax=Hypsizygus marmoreus TaxID=39966 RepID=A0A369JAR5_HYPMA|nr:hypothetical protein Hypma_000341 [Hypsizygus marmoreus]
MDSITPRSDLPAEIWAQIFDQAADEDVIFQYGLPSSMAESAWFKNFHDEWALRRPTEALNLVQRRSYTTKKAIVSTCKAWHRMGSELLFRCLFFNDPRKLLSLCETLDSSSATATTVSSSLGWWTRRIHLTSYRRSTTISELEDAFISVIRHCPNLEIFIVDVPMEKTFGPVADALATYTLKSLRTVHWTVSCEALPKVIWALDSLPNIVCAHINFDTNKSEDPECIPLGSASGLRLNLPRLQQLSLRGYFGQFLEQAVGWSIPSLKSFTFDCGTHRTDQPDAVGFLTAHGAKLVFLDLNCIPALNVAKILDLCPRLTTFSFNADWRVQPPSQEVQANGGSTTTSQTMSILVNQPHQNITTIGLHGLMYAFGVGFAAEISSGDPLRAHVIRRSNDLNVAALNRSNFPKLLRVRTLSPSMLTDLNKADGPSQEEGGMERYDLWWGMLSGVGIRLEDCTGALLGTLPVDEDEEDEESDEEEEEESDEYEYESEDDEVEGDSSTRRRPRVSNISELRQLLEECRAMEEKREESPFAAMLSGMMNMDMAVSMGTTSN